MRSSAALLVLLFAAAAIAGPYADLDRRIKNAPPATAVRVVRESDLVDSDSHLSDLLSASSKSGTDIAKSVKAYVSLRALMESAGPQSKETPIKQIKGSGLYRKPTDETGENWVQRAIERIRFNVPTPKINAQPPPRMALGGFQFMVYVMWALLALAGATFLFFAIRYFHWKVVRAGKYRAMAMIEDDEPERTLDEWLELATNLEAEGKFREAVRCLYVACLLRFDEYRVARFDRTQTNWEHFRRISSSPNKPADFDFRPPTSEFDHIWYGMRPTGAVEVQRFRDIYQELTRLLAKQAVSLR